MPLTLVGDINATALATAVTAVVPVGTVDGDAVCLPFVSKPSTSVITTPTDWAFGESRELGTGAVGVDTGPVRIGFFWRVQPPGGMAIPALTPSGTNPVISVGAVTFRPDPGETVAVTATYGADTVADTAWSVTGAAMLPFDTSDQVLIINGITSDAPVFTGGAITATGATFTTPDSKWNAGTATGNDLRHVAFTAQVNSGPATGVPVHTATTSVALNSTGGAVIARLRSFTVPPPPTVLVCNRPGRTALVRAAHY